MRSPKHVDLDPGRDLHELKLGNKPRRPVLSSGPKRVAENAADRVFCRLLAINRHRPAGPARKLPGIVEPKQVVGVRVRERNRIDDPHSLTQELDPHLGRGIDQQVTPAERQQDARPGPLISRIGRCANRAVAADHGNAAGRTSPQKSQPRSALRLPRSIDRSPQQLPAAFPPANS